MLSQTQFTITISVYLLLLQKKFNGAGKGEKYVIFFMVAWQPLLSRQRRLKMLLICNAPCNSTLTSL